MLVCDFVGVVCLVSLFVWFFFLFCVFVWLVLLVDVFLCVRLFMCWRVGVDGFFMLLWCAELPVHVCACFYMSVYLCVCMHVCRHVDMYVCKYMSVDAVMRSENGHASRALGLSHRYHVVASRVQHWVQSSPRRESNRHSQLSSLLVGSTCWDTQKVTRGGATSYSFAGAHKQSAPSATLRSEKSH